MSNLHHHRGGTAFFYLLPRLEGGGECRGRRTHGGGGVLVDQSTLFSPISPILCIMPLCPFLPSLCEGGNHLKNNHTCLTSEFTGLPFSAAVVSKPLKSVSWTPMHTTPSIPSLPQRSGYSMEPTGALLLRFAEDEAGLLPLFPRHGFMRTLFRSHL